MIDVAEAAFDLRILCQEHPALQTVDTFAFELVIAPVVHTARPEAARIWVKLHTLRS